MKKVVTWFVIIFGSISLISILLNLILGVSGEGVNAGIDSKCMSIGVTWLSELKTNNPKITIGPEKKKIINETELSVNGVGSVFKGLKRLHAILPNFLGTCDGYIKYKINNCKHLDQANAKKFKRSINEHYALMFRSQISSYINEVKGDKPINIESIRLEDILQYIKDKDFDNCIKNE